MPRTQKVCKNQASENVLDEDWSRGQGGAARFSYSADTYCPTYQKARALVADSGLSVDDIVHLRPKFWKFHLDLVSTRDSTAWIIAAIHLNLCIGTIGSFAQSRPDLDPLLNELMTFRVCGSFLLTEFGHGLDVQNLETMATLLTDGSFDLHSPNENSAKTMPPSAPVAGLPRIGLVVARLFVGDEDRGLKLFIVPLSGPSQMREGVTSWMLPARPGTKPLDHSITSFTHVKLPSTALLGTMEKPDNSHTDIRRQLWRVTIGALTISLANVNSLRVASYIAACYSKRRLVGRGPLGGVIPIISFSTQYRPILRGLVAGEMLLTFAHSTIDAINAAGSSLHVRRGMITVFKATVLNSFGIMQEVAERCGWRGFYPHNQIAELYLTFSGNAVAEGDVQVLTLRLAYELLAGKYALGKPKDPHHLLARHEVGLTTELRETLATHASKARHEQAFNTLVLPRCRSLIVAIGQRMAFEAAKESQSAPDQVLHAFERACIAEDASWYVENLGFTRKNILEAEGLAYENLLPLLDDLLDRTGAEHYVTSPLVSKSEWHVLIGHCPKFTSQGSRQDQASQAKI